MVKEAISISLKSVKRQIMLFATYSKDNMPEKMMNVIESPRELFEVIGKMDEGSVRVSEKD